MQRSTLGRLREQARTVSRTRTVPVQRLEIALDVNGHVLGPGVALVGPDRFEVPPCVVREGLLYLAVDGILGGPAEIVLDDGACDWDGTLPGRDVLLLGAVQGTEVHLHKAVAQREGERLTEMPPAVRSIAEVLDGPLVKDPVDVPPSAA
jgi:hypothetical protein